MNKEAKSWLRDYGRRPINHLVYDTPFKSTHPHFYRFKSNAIDNLTDKGESLFEKCETAGCVYFLGADIENWYAQIRKMNKSVSFGPIRLKRRKIFSKRKIKKSLRKIVEAKAKKLPIALFN